MCKSSILKFKFCVVVIYPMLTIYTVSVEKMNAFHYVLFTLVLSLLCNNYCSLELINYIINKSFLSLSNVQNRSLQTIELLKCVINNHCYLCNVLSKVNVHILPISILVCLYQITSSYAINVSINKIIIKLRIYINYLMLTSYLH